MNLKHTVLTTLMALGLAASQSTWAVPVTSNLSESPSAFAPIFPSSWRAQSFTVANDQDYVLTDVQIAVTSPVGTTFASIYSDSASRPGALLEQLSFGSLTPSLITFNSSSLNLTAGSTYWVVGGQTSGGPTYWNATSSGVETGLSGWSIGNTSIFTNNSGGSWSGNISLVQQLSIGANPAAAAVPEPATLALMGIAGLGLLRRRKAA